jgi:hypothetical protein
MQPSLSTSPDNEHHVVLEYLNEIRFGPPYYSLMIDEFSFGERIFGSSYLWSPDSRFFAIQEWETIIEGQGPQTHLLLINVGLARECVLSPADQGFIVPKKFDKDKLHHTKEYYGRGMISEFEIEFLSSDRWDPLNN